MSRLKRKGILQVMKSLTDLLAGWRETYFSIGRLNRAKSLLTIMPVASCLLIAALGLSACIGAGSVSDITIDSEKDSPMESLPEITGIDLLGDERRIPQDLRGDYHLVTFAFEQEQQKQVDTWIGAFPNIAQGRSWLHYYEVPLIYRMNAVERFWVNNGMRSGIPGEEARERTITVFTDREKFLELMDMKTSSIYTLLIDRQGRILWRVDGPAAAEKLDALDQVLSDLEMPGTEAAH